MLKKVMVLATVAGAMLGGCSSGVEEVANNELTLRNLTESNLAVPAGERDFRLKGTVIPTPSDTRSTYYLLRERRAIGGNIIAILREERGDRIVYARAEVDCVQRRFHILGVGSSRATAEVARTPDGPLRSMEGLPLRQDLGVFICARSGTPLAPA